MPNKIVIAVTGASGSIYAKLLIETLLTVPQQYGELSIVMSNNAKDVWEMELGNDGYTKYPIRFFDKNNFAAPFASGSANYNIMFVVPCSMGALGRIASGVSDDLVTRAADVMLKERRKLILAVRETPYNLAHIKNMELVTLAGGIIAPCTPSFYSKPASIDDLVKTVVHRLLSLAGIDVPGYKWGDQ